MDTPQNLSQQLSFQAGAVVSKEILNRPSGTITLFAFDGGQGLSEHAAPYDAYVIGVEGEAEITVDGTPQTVKTGETILMPANHPHAVKALTPFKMLLVMIRS